MKLNYIYVIPVLLLALCSCTRDNTVKIPVTYKYDDKIVYTIDMDYDKRKLKWDCENWQGTFNECGSLCDDLHKDVNCVEACALTCDNIKEKKDS